MRVPVEEAAGFFITGADITKCKKLDEVLHLSEERLRIASGNASDAIMEWDFSTDKIRTFGKVRGPERNQFPGTMEEMTRSSIPTTASACCPLCNG
jgi:hypothetical protein